MQFGESEVQDLRLPLLSDEDVRRFDIAMDDAFVVRGFEPFRNLDSCVEQRFELKCRLVIRICLLRN